MNEHLHNWIWNYSKTTSQHMLVLLALAKHANGAGEATVTLSVLARMCRCGEADAKLSLRYAVNMGELEIIKNSGKSGERLTNTYRFKIFAGPKGNGEEDDIQFEEPPLPGIPLPKVKDLPKEPQPKIMMSAEALAEIAADPIYKGLDVNAQAWKFKRWCAAQVPPVDTTVRRFKVWLSKV
jgi:hypothetical protein